MSTWLVRMDLNAGYWRTTLVRGSTASEAFERALTLWLKSEHGDAERSREGGFCYDIWPVDGITIDRDVDLTAIQGATIYPNRVRQTA